MINLEKEISNNLCISTYLLEDDNIICNIDNINEPFILDVSKKMINPIQLNNASIYPKGGVLADEIGLGKTFSMID